MDEEEYLEPLPSGCGRCEKSVDHYEYCWFCQGHICPACWEEFGHCGHKKAEESIARTKR